MKRCQSWVVAVLLLGATGARGKGDESSPLPSATGSSAQKPEVKRRWQKLGAELVEGDMLPSAPASPKVPPQASTGQPSGGASTDGQSSGLVVNMVNGQRDVWTAEEKGNLRYCVSKEFGAQYPAVVQAMGEATRDWESAAGVDFQHLSSRDDTCYPSEGDDERGKVLFYVVPENLEDANAAAFFPHAPPAQRLLRIDWPAASTAPRKTLPGILRHELGHVLGFRHEHVRPDACLFQETDGQWEALTQEVDRASVMYYVSCPDRLGDDYVLSEHDRRAASELYGPSLQ